MMRRRELLQTVGVGWLADQLLPDRGQISGSLVGASHELGHKLRELPQMTAGGAAEHVEVVIVGAGASGISAAWRLAGAGVSALMLELEPSAGGTSSWSDDGAVSHPWGAHYLPVPERGVRSVARLLEELGVIVGWDAAGRPQFFEEMLCHAPEERLHFRGRWHDGLLPVAALDARERTEVERFKARQHELLEAKGNDGREAFAIPFEHSSRDPRYLELDRMTMRQWLRRNGFETDFLHWYVEYAALDDFGASLDDLSAWAGWHYFASRKLLTEQLVGSRYLVWPEGNGWLLRRMLATIPAEVRTGALVTAVQTDAKGRVDVHYLDVAAGVVRRIRARAAIVAAPAFIANRIFPRAALPVRIASPWVVANIHVQRPAEPNLAWDTMIYDGVGLGYVDAGHQRTQSSDRTFLTYFRAYGHSAVHATRARLQTRSWADLASEALVDLARVHPRLALQTERIDVRVLGHAMPRPRPGFIGDRPFEALTMIDDRIGWAHVDQTGFALFEEASFRGVRAAEAICDVLGARRGESWL